MTIAKDRVVTIQYTLMDDKGNVLDTNLNSAPLSYLHGTGMLLPGVEAALEGKTSGDDATVHLAAEQGYGVRDDSLLLIVPREQLKELETEDIGARFKAKTSDGEQVFTLVGMDDENWTIDGNHPLAGVDLNFAISVLDIRESSDEERDHGHVHNHIDPHIQN